MGEPVGKSISTQLEVGHLGTFFANNLPSLMQISGARIGVACCSAFDSNLFIKLGHAMLIYNKAIGNLLVMMH